MTLEEKKTFRLNNHNQSINNESDLDPITTSSSKKKKSKNNKKDYSSAIVVHDTRG